MAETTCTMKFMCKDVDTSSDFPELVPFFCSTGFLFNSLLMFFKIDILIKIFFILLHRVYLER